MTLGTNNTHIAAFWRPKFSAKINGATSSRGRSICYITTWQIISQLLIFLLSHSSRRCLHSLRVLATQENSSPSVWR